MDSCPAFTLLKRYLTDSLQNKPPDLIFIRINQGIEINKKIENALIDHK